ncbi:MAG: hypothetical protein JNM95_11595 [Chitinophagaceae bacterium]|nr:hypothetical protein [Chitinophagaceae bacterium]
MNSERNRKGLLQHLGIKHHEYWSWWWFSFPIWPQWIWYAIKLRNPTWFTAVNPGIEHSGFTEESKFDILSILPKENVPETILIDFEKPLPHTLLSFPCIAKPDIGGRGRKIKIIHTFTDLEEYHRTVGEHYLLQEVINYNLELGVFYARIPSECKGNIISITEKDFLKVVGDGLHTIEELLQNSFRAQGQLSRLAHTIDLSEVLPDKEERIIEPIGNHCRGTVFLDKSNRITSLMEHNFDKIAKQIPGFYYGRFDIRVRSWDDFIQGKEIYILELNGLTSMDTHIFDPQFKLRNVLPVLIKNCNFCYRIARENLKRNIPTSPLGIILKKSLAFFNE